MANDSDNITRNIVSEVMRECKNHKINVDVDFVTFYANLLKLDPNRGLSEDFLNIRGRVQQFIKYMVSSLQTSDDPKIIILKLQQEFRASLQTTDESVNNFRKRIDHKLYPLLLEITEPDYAPTVSELYLKLTCYVTLKSGLGNPLDRNVYREALQVIRSILEPDEIEVFSELLNFIKQEIVASLVDISTGIRIYNKHCNKGSEGIADLPNLMENAITSIKSQVQVAINETERRARLLVNFLTKHMTYKPIRDDYCIHLDFATEKEKEEWHYVKDLSIVYRQCNKTSKILFKKLEDLELTRSKLYEDYINTLKKLDDIIVPKLYQSVLLVFPYFTQLSRTWQHFQDNAIRLREITHIFEKESKLVFSLVFDPSHLDTQSVADFVCQSQSTLIAVERFKNTKVKIRYDLGDIMKRDLEFNGYCCWTMVHTHGALFPGKTKLGVVEYENKFYVFYSALAANCFAKYPDRYIGKTIELARNNVHLIKYLNLEKQLIEKADIKELYKTEVEDPLTIICHQECQTEVHFVDTNKDPNYFWNIWEYKKWLTKRADLQHMKSVATSTGKMWTKSSGCSQTYGSKQGYTQTHTENYTNTSIPKKFYYGLRGVRDNRPTLLNLGSPRKVSETPFKYKR